MRFNLTFADLPLELSTVEDFAKLVARSENELKEQARRRVWEDLDRRDEAELQLGWDLEGLVDRGVALRFLSAASLVAAWAVYEAAVSRAAAYLRKKREAALKLSDLRGDFISRSRKYFDDVLKTDLHPPGTDWGRLEAIAKLRHAYAHGSGRLAHIAPDRRAQLRQLVAETDGLMLDDEAYLIVSSSYATAATAFVSDCVGELIERIAPIVGSVNDT